MVTNSKIISLKETRSILDTMKHADGAYFNIISDELGIQDNIIGSFVKTGGYSFDKETIGILGILANTHEKLRQREMGRDVFENYAVEMELQGDRYVTLDGLLEGEGRGSRIMLTLKTDKAMDACYREFFGEEADERNLHPLTKSKEYDLVSRIVDDPDSREETGMTYFYMAEQILPESPILEIKLGDFRINRYVEGEQVTDIELARPY
ncbi:MAG: hypothetical protein GOV00_03645 [Candidatus Altiarchaeota archaeon]|nr:hypothetical protein [Candidatus Altiarchaeota archaeon]